MPGDIASAWAKSFKRCHNSTRHPGQWSAPVVGMDDCEPGSIEGPGGVSLCLDSAFSDREQIKCVADCGEYIRRSEDVI